MVDHSGPGAELLKIRSSEDSKELRKNTSLVSGVLTKTPLNQSRRYRKSLQLPI